MINTQSAIDALAAWHDTPTHQALTHVIDTLETLPSTIPLQHLLELAQQAHTATPRGPGHDPSGNEYCQPGCTQTDYRTQHNCPTH